TRPVQRRQILAEQKADVHGFQGFRDLVERSERDRGASHSMKGEHMTKYTPEDLLAMSQSEFHEAVMNDLTETSSYRGPFQHPSVVERTMSTLVEWLWITNAKLAER